MPLAQNAAGCYKYAVTGLAGQVDPRKATLTLKNRHGMVSLVASLTDAHLEYGVRKAVNLIHEVFVDFLRHPLYFPYMVEHFDVDPDM